MLAARRHIPDDGLTRHAWSKLERARQHLVELRRETRQWVAGNPWTFSARVEGDDRMLVVRVHLTPAGERIPRRLGLIAGDAIHNLRSALDHLVWALAGSKADRINQFPVLVDRTEWARKRGTMLHDVPDPAAATIESFQPYRVRDAIMSSPAPIERHDPLAHNANLLAIVRLDNIDKHRVILPPRPLAKIDDARLRAMGFQPSHVGAEWIEVTDGREVLRLSSRFGSADEAAQVVRRAVPLTILYGNPWDGSQDMWSDPECVALTGADIAQAAQSVEAVLSRF